LERPDFNKIKNAIFIEILHLAGKNSQSIPDEKPKEGKKLKLLFGERKRVCTFALPIFKT